MLRVPSVFITSGKFGFVRAYLRTGYLQLVKDESCKSWNVRNCRWRNTSGVGSQIQSGMLAETVDVRGLIAGKTPSFTVPGSWTSWWSWNSENTSECFHQVGFTGITIKSSMCRFLVLWLFFVSKCLRNQLFDS